MSSAGVLRSIVDVLGSNTGIITMAVLAVVGIGSPFLDRWVIRPRRIEYQVVYNSRIGLDTAVFREHDDDEESSPAFNNPLGRLVHELERLSVMIIRIRNEGSADIKETDIHPPLALTFGSRVIWNARVSEASDDELRTHIRENLEFFTHVDWPTHSELNALLDKQSTGYEYRNLAVVRRWLVDRLAKTLTRTPDQAQSGEKEPQWHGVRMAKLWLRRRQSFILMVVLREAGEKTVEISKDYRVTGGGGNRKTLIHERRGGLRWGAVTTAIGVIVAGALLGTVLANGILGAQPAEAGPGVACVSGTANLSGSSAFGPIVQRIGDDYMAACPGARVVVSPTGSIDGVRALGDQPENSANQAALSDGQTAAAPPNLGRQQLVVLVYALVLNKDIGIRALTTGQVRGIYRGDYTSWDQLGGAQVPIRIVGREASSGTRQTFEQYVLSRNSEGELSSSDCQARDRAPESHTTLCERGSTKDLIDTVSKVPGAIGYADVANQDTKVAVQRGLVAPVVLDGHDPQVASVPNYPFWTVEYIYTWTPGTTTPIGAFDAYLKSDRAQETLRAAGYTPCVAPGGSINPLCTQR